MSLRLNLLTERRSETGASRLVKPFVFGGFATTVYLSAFSGAKLKQCNLGKLVALS